MSVLTHQAILGRVRAALGRDKKASKLAADYAALPRPYTRAGNLDTAGRLALLIHRLREYDAEVVECASGEIAQTIAAQLTASNRRRILTPPGLPAAWRAPGFTWQIDDGLSATEIEQVEGVVTGAFCAVADSGTIVLHHSPSEGRRVLTLLPDWHLCVLYASQVVETLPEYFARCTTPPPLVTWISGPSATADIEMTRIKGVHGPRFLQVVVAHDEAVDSGPAEGNSTRP